MGFRSSAIAVLALPWLVVSAGSERPEDLSRGAAALCIDVSAPAAIRIDACTWMIRHGHLRAENLAIALNNRGVAKRETADLAGALADLSEAIRLSPTALSYGARAWVHCSVAWRADDAGDDAASRAAYAAAESDMQRALALDPSSGSLDGLCY
ncbi:MAG TPA: hypothetical protein VE907_04815 [Gammaproteobacteria bacterium]|nr:hypothetical protein [Gammaproteobacteria bacterium]